MLTNADISQPRSDSSVRISHRTRTRTFFFGLSGCCWLVVEVSYLSNDINSDTITEPTKVARFTSFGKILRVREFLGEGFWFSLRLSREMLSESSFF